MTELKLEDLYCVYFQDADSDSDYNADYEVIYHGLNNARKAAIDYVSKFEDHHHCPEVGDRVLIYKTTIGEDGSLRATVDTNNRVESYETVGIEWDDNDNEIYTYSVTDSCGNKEIRVNK